MLKIDYPFTRKFEHEIKNEKCICLDTDDMILSYMKIKDLIDYVKNGGEVNGLKISSNNIVQITLSYMSGIYMVNNRKVIYRCLMHNKLEIVYDSLVFIIENSPYRIYINGKGYNKTSNVKYIFETRIPSFYMFGILDGFLTFCCDRIYFQIDIEDMHLYAKSVGSGGIDSLGYSKSKNYDRGKIITYRIDREGYLRGLALNRNTKVEDFILSKNDIKKYDAKLFRDKYKL